MRQLAEFLGARRKSLTDFWVAALRQNREEGHVPEVDDEGLIDHLPHLFDDLVAGLRGEPASAKQTADDAQKHGRARWEQRYRLEEVLSELGITSRLLFEHGFDPFANAHPELDREALRPAREAILRFFEDTANGSAWQYLLRQQEMAAELSELRRLALGSAQMGTWHFDLATQHVHWDDQFKAVFGVVDGELSLERTLMLLHPDDREGVRAALVAASQPDDPVPYAIEYRVAQPDGSWRWVQAHGKTYFEGEGGVAAVVNVLLVKANRLVAVLAVHEAQPRGWTAEEVALIEVVAERSWGEVERSRAVRELAFERHQLELIFQESPAAMTIWRGEDLVFTRVNPEYQDVFRGRQLLGRPLMEACPELASQGFDDLLRRVLHTGAPFTGREMLAKVQKDKDGPVENRYFDFTYLQVCDAENRPWGVYDHAVNVTDRVLARLAVEQTQCDIRQALSDREQLLQAEQTARSEAERVSQLKDEFLATLSHELRTPLNAILGWTQVLREDPALGEDLAAGLATIERNAKAQTQIIEDLLDMSKIAADQPREPRPGPFSMGLIATREFDLYGDRPELASLINEVQREMEALLNHRA